ncbi:PPOX class F420-dependent oxidoreductase [Sphaerisporangium fuscum]|uniref:PPOX class F420-dependent oxidoreductase n=1 Tax=Sphaerisporangium fuscum TaxID=2835868 RepID=UPI001BDC473E|nr:PPOX class F420-dependent oxidoreductase [Sphaerisporangium fuscum]
MTTTKPGSGPAPRLLGEQELSRLLAGQKFGVLATLKRDGHPHLATILYAWSPQERRLRISTTAGRLKARHLRNDPRATLHVSAGPFSYAVAEGLAEVSEPSRTPGDAVGRQLLALTPGFDDPADEAAFLEQMVADERVVLTIAVTRLYGTALDVPEGV